MKLLGRMLILLSHLCLGRRIKEILPAPAAFDPAAVDHVLRTIEFEADVHAGVFSCIFYNGARTTEPYDGSMLGTVLESPRMDRVMRYVVDRGYDAKLADPKNLPNRPSLLLINPGRDGNHLARSENGQQIYLFLRLFSPVTKVLIFAERTNLAVFYKILHLMNDVEFNDYVFLDVSEMSSLHCNAVRCRSYTRTPPPLKVFIRRSMQGRLITYLTNEPRSPFAWNAHWLYETARYLGTVAVEYEHNCKGSGEAYQQCVDKAKTYPIRVDVVFQRMEKIPVGALMFRNLYTTIPVITKIVVPRDRQLNAVELMSMPFSWQTWSLLAGVLVASEVTKHFWPGLFRNDPILLAVCGFERHNLHQAGRSEKILFLSLIILMFFMSNAYETKIVSLMVSKPSIQRIKTIADLKRTEVRFCEDLENHPYFLNDTIIGDLVVQGERKEVFETIPRCAVFWEIDFIDVYNDLAYDYNRMQPFFVVLDYEYFTDIEVYVLKFRSPFLETFRYIHITLVEAGLFTFWKQQWKDDMRSVHVGRRPREDAGTESDLSFDDMLPAWMVLTAGLIFSIVGFAAELLKAQLDSWLSQKFKNPTTSKSSKHSK